MKSDERELRIDVSDIPDLVPILSVAAAFRGSECVTVFTGASRLRLKESDRLASTEAMIHSLGGKAEAATDTLTVFGGGLSGGNVDSYNDHRIVMAAAIAATACKNDVTIMGAEAHTKSYPAFVEHFQKLGGKTDVYIR